MLALRLKRLQTHLDRLESIMGDLRNGDDLGVLSGCYLIEACKYATASVEEIHQILWRAEQERRKTRKAGK